MPAQEKNRKAQRRFRERQRNKVTSLEMRVEELTRQNDMIRTEAQVMQVQFATLGRMHHLAQQECQAWAAGDEEKARELQVRRRAPGPRPPAPASPTRMPPPSSRRLARRPQPPPLRPRAPQRAAQGVSGGTALVAGGAMQETSALMADGTDRQALYEQHLEEGRKLLSDLSRAGHRMGAEPPRDAAVAESCAATAQALTREVAKVAGLGGHGVKRIYATQLETRTDASLESAAQQEVQWRARLASLGLNPAQRAHLVRLRDDHTHRLAGIHRDRQLLQGQIFTAQPEGLKGMLYLEAHIMRVQGLLKTLSESFEKEQEANSEFVILLCGALSPTQVLRVCDVSHPYFPDPLALANAVYHGAREDPEVAAVYESSYGADLPTDVPFPRFGSLGHAPDLRAHPAT